jgi:plastocyanin
MPARLRTPGIIRAIAGVQIAVAAMAIVSARAAVSAYQAEPFTHGGTITGAVTYAGTPPKPKPVEITKDVDACRSGPQFDQSLIVGKDGGVANAIVALADITRGAPPIPEHDVEFDQIHCEYTPRVLAFPAGSTVVVINSDGILHNVHTESSANPPINMAQPGFKRRIEVSVIHPELIKVSCDAHNWMQGWWYAAANPYYAVTGPDGRFTIRNVPPGSYTLTVWQERLGTFQKKVTVPPDGTAKIDFHIDLQGNSPQG